MCPPLLKILNPPLINCVHASNWFTHLQQIQQTDGQSDNSVLTVYIVDSHTHLSHCELLTLHSYCTVAVELGWRKCVDLYASVPKHYIQLDPSTLYPSTMFFPLETRFLSFQTVFYSSSEMNVLFTPRQPQYMYYWCQFSGELSPPVKNFRGPPAPLDPTPGYTCTLFAY